MFKDDANNKTCNTFHLIQKLKNLDVDYIQNIFDRIKNYNKISKIY